MDIVRYQSLPASRWSNGGGVTRQIAASAAADWDWRISIAEVRTAGPFSDLPGIDRVLTIIAGELIVLTVDGEEHPLERFRPFRFSGDSSTSAVLPTGDVMDLNVMTRRGKFTGYTAIVELSKKRPHPVFAGQHAVLLQGSASVSDGAGAPPAQGTEAGTTTTAPAALDRFDVVVGSAAAPEVSGRGFLAIVSIDPVSAED
ncbi:HutD family protein [Paenarthrobacter sp. Z7-10]|uniref:HutD/Ves family protein n=1 Tax=Paenarthrobacter sp. Z7-10 TaxID=2787635 RepID=UPI0022A8D546|nr:HutD family protein [Paenarthrobacter sp. Z7-10]MCZ2401842.1 HutD family protein [Paenarthrobacter sp. Z7-10]